MDPNLNTACPTPSKDSSNSLNQYTPLYKPIPIVGSSRSLVLANDDVSPEISAAMTPADIVALDHNYTFPPVLVEVPLLKPIANPSDAVLDDSKPVKCPKPEKPVKSPKVNKKEKAKPIPPPAEKPYWSGSTNYIFQIKSDIPPKSTSTSDQSIFMPHIKSSVFPASPTMSKLEHLLKSPTRSPSSRRSPSSFLSPSLNYHRCKNVAGAGPPAAVYEKEVEKEADVDVDIESVDPDPVLPYDSNRARNLMKECEKNVIFLRQAEVSEDWEEQIVKTGWTNSQIDIFDKVLHSLHQERLSRLVNQNRNGEPVLRRLSIDKTAQRIRKVLGSYKWDSHLTQWLHGVLVDSLSFEYLSAYLDVLQTLRVKFPDLIDKMIILTTGLLNEPMPIDPSMLANSENSDLSPGGTSNLNSLKETMKRSLNSEAIGLVLKRKWDPFSSTVQHSKAKKLPSSPIFVIIATNPTKSHSITSKRKKHFVSLLAGRGKVVSVTLNITAQVHMRLHYYMGRLFRIASERVRDLKRQFPERPIFAVGWASGALLACKLSAIETVAGVITLGFRLHGLFNKGSLSVNVLQINCPSLFIIGGLTNYSSILEMETLRQDMSCVASLLVVGCANDELCITNSYRKKLLVTQTYIDKCVVEEIVKFLSTCPVPIPSPEEKAISLAITAAKSKKKVSKLQNASALNATIAAANAELRLEMKAEGEMEKTNDTSMGMSSEQERTDITDFDFDGPIMIPSNTSSNKRKAYYRPAPSVTSPAEKSSPVCITASQLVQQNPGVKRFSKPSGPNIPKPKRQGIVNTQPVASSLVKNDNSVQTQLQSPLVSPTANYLETESMPNSLVFNLLSSTPAQMLRVKRDQETIVTPDVAAPTRFLFAVEESPPPSPSVMIDKGLKPYLPQPLVLPIPNNQIIKSEYDHSGFKQKETVAEIVQTQQWQQQLPPPPPTPSQPQPPPPQSPPKVMVSSSNTAIITSPTILPGGATATPFIRQTLPTTPVQQQFSSHLFRLLTPPHEPTARRPSFSEIPMPTRVNEDLTATILSTTHLLTTDINLLSKESTELSSLAQRKDDKGNAQKEIQTPATALPKEVPSLSISPAKAPEGDTSNAYTVDNQISKSKYISANAQPMGTVVANNSPASSLVSPLKSDNINDKNSSILATDCATMESKELEMSSNKTITAQINVIDNNDKEEKVVLATKVDTLDIVLNKSAEEEKLIVESDKCKELQMLSKLEVVATSDGNPGTDSSNMVVDGENSLKYTPEQKEQEVKDVEKDLKDFSSPKLEKPKASFERIVESVAFGLDLEEERQLNRKNKEGKKIGNPSSKKKEKCEDLATKQSQKTSKDVDVLDTKVCKRKKGSSPTSSTKSSLPSVAKESGNRKTRNEARTSESKMIDIVEHFAVEKNCSQPKGKMRNSCESQKGNQSKKKHVQQKTVDDEKSEKVMSGNSKTKRVLKGVKPPVQESLSKEQELLPKKLTRSSSTPTSDEPIEKLKGPSPTLINVETKVATETTPKSTEKYDCGRKRSSSCLSRPSDLISETPTSRLRNRSGNSSSSAPKTNPHTLRKKSRLTYRENSDSDSSNEMMDEILPMQSRKKTAKQLKKKSSSSESFESGESFDESEDKEVAPRVTRSMRRHSVPDSIANESSQSSSVKEHDSEIVGAVKEIEVAADNELSKPDPTSDEKSKESRERNSSGSICSGDDEDLECRKRPKPIHPVTPASLSVTRTRKISIPNYFAYGM